MVIRSRFNIGIHNSVEQGSALRRYSREIFRYIFEYDVLVNTVSKTLMAATIVSWIIIGGNWLYLWFNYSYLSQQQLNQLIATSLLYTLLLSFSVLVAYSLPYYVPSARPKTHKRISETKLRDIIIIGSLILLIMIIVAYILLGYYYMKAAM